MNIEEAWVAQEAERLAYGLAMAREDAELVERHVELDRSAVRAAMLAAHVDACEEFIYKASVAEYTSSQPISEKQRCGDDWYCDKAIEIQELGR